MHEFNLTRFVFCLLAVIFIIEASFNILLHNHHLIGKWQLFQSGDQKSDQVNQMDTSVQPSNNNYSWKGIEWS